ncbi:MAG: response regulator [Flavipsychrobacter sp.]|nr:response regulator [Flavipsychrobacter sp.]
MKSIKLLIIDDEPLARDILASYVEKLPYLQLVATCKNALEAFAILNKEPVDLMLLDINMPEITGIDFLKALKKPPNVIFTTAYPEYAAHSYDFDAVDYLVKPIAFDRFMKAINKVADVLNNEQKSTIAPIRETEVNRNIIFVKTEGKLVKIDLAQVWFIEGLKDYVQIWTDTGKLTVHSTMKNFEEQLSDLSVFLRVNKSYIINMNFVNEVDGNLIRIKGQMITIGNTYKDEVHQIFNKFKIN